MKHIFKSLRKSFRNIPLIKHNSTKDLTLYSIIYICLTLLLKGKD